MATFYGGPFHGQSRHDVPEGPTIKLMLPVPITVTDVTDVSEGAPIVRYNRRIYQTETYHEVRYEFDGDHHFPYLRRCSHLKPHDMIIRNRLDQMRLEVMIANGWMSGFGRFSGGYCLTYLPAWLRRNITREAIQKLRREDNHV